MTRLPRPLLAGLVLLAACGDRTGPPRIPLGRVEARLDAPDPILLLPIGAPVPLSCTVNTRSGTPAVSPPVRLTPGGPVGGTDCSNLTVKHSGTDTIRILTGFDTVRVPVAVAVPPVLRRPADDRLRVDGLPGLVAEWAPSARIGANGRLEIYFAGTTGESTPTGNARTSMYRVVSDPGFHLEDVTQLQLRFDGMMLDHDSADCAPNGDGLENMVILPRTDAPGWRMLYASGGFTCYGWQVFSAVSDDGDHWTKETGARISNGAPLPPAPPGPVPFPAGEGMWAERLASGEWRLLVGAYDPKSAESKFQILEYRSPDQLNWTYVRPVLTTHQLPADAQRSVYSPAVRAIGNGIWRMVFTADNLNQPGGRSRLYSAVSTDKINWQLEGTLLAHPDTNYFYSAVAGDLLVYITALPGKSGTLHASALLMP